MKNKFNHLLGFIIMSLAIVLSGCSLTENILHENSSEVTIETVPMRSSESAKENSSDGLDDLKIDPDRWQDDKYDFDQKLLENKAYYSMHDVAAYIHQYQKLPSNYITKSQAEQINWTINDKELVIGGDLFGNREGRLPKANGRQYYEADIQAGYSHHRGPERIVYSNDGLIFYTEDHYDSFKQLYGKDESE